MTIQTEVITFAEWQKMDEAIRAALCIKGTFFSRFNMHDYGVEIKDMLDRLDSGTTSLHIARTMSGSEKLVILSVCDLSQDPKTVEALGAFWDTDTSASTENTGYKYRQDVLTRLRNIIKHEEAHQNAHLYRSFTKTSWEIDKDAKS